MSDQVDVLVVGAGPTGLALAAQLHRYGARFRIVDRSQDRVHESRALAVQPRTLEVLAGLGVTEAMVEAGNHAVRLQLHAGGRTVPVQLFDFGVDDTAYPYLLFLSQAETERILSNHLTRQGVALERGVELCELNRADDTSTCVLRHRDGREEIVRADYVVGCDGAHSTVREQAEIAFEGMAYPQTFVLADVEADGVEPGAAHAFLAARGILFFFPLGSPATWRIIAMRPHSDHTSANSRVTLDEVQALVEAYPPTAVRLRDPVWMTNFRLHNRGAARYRSGRIFLAGDAAHIHSPAGAQGMNTGVQDAVNLGWKLALVTTGRADPRLLDTYETERAPVGRRVLRFTDRAFNAGTSTNPLVRLVRVRLVPRLLPFALRFRRARTAGLRTVSQLAIHYRHSRLSVGAVSPWTRGPRPGDRLPDAHITRDGEVGTLHGAVSDQGFHALLCGPVGVWRAAAVAELAEQFAGVLTVHYLTRDHVPGVLYDHAGEASHRLRLRNSIPVHFLVRPDGHIAYRARGTDMAGPNAYLERWLTSTVAY